MPYEYPTEAGLLRLSKERGRWLLHFAGRRAGGWRSADSAAKAVARRKSGHPEWDRQDDWAPEDLLDWRPIGDSL
jgi:hypothetical protein